MPVMTDSWRSSRKDNWSTVLGTAGGFGCLRFGRTAGVVVRSRSVTPPCSSTTVATVTANSGWLTKTSFTRTPSC